MEIPKPVADALGAITLEQIVMVVVAFAAAFLFLRKGWPWLVAMVALVGALDELPGALKDIRAKLDSHDEALKVIKHEVLPNGGASLADKAGRTEAAVEHMKRQQAATKTTLFKLNRRMKSIELQQHKEE